MRGLSGLRQREGRSDSVFTVLRLPTGLILMAIVSQARQQKGSGILISRRAALVIQDKGLLECIEIQS